MASVVREADERMYEDRNGQVSSESFRDVPVEPR